MTLSTAGYSTGTMTDAHVHEHIEKLVAEEHRLLSRSEAKLLDENDRKRLDEVNVQLDRYFDLLRQRRAREEFGQDPDSARLRDGVTVERYVQ